MNENSSRSHFLIFLNLERKNQIDFSTQKSTLCIVDLAGSERLDRTEVKGEGLKEANSINQSLTKLGLVIL